MKIGFIGCGNMGSAMITGILNKKIFAPQDVIASVRTAEHAAELEMQFGITMTLDNREVVENSRIVVLAVKPMFYEKILKTVSDLITPEHIIVSITPGKTLEWLEGIIGKPAKIVRLMPNIPAKVGAAMTGACYNQYLSEEEIGQIRQIVESFGRIEFLPEYLMDAVLAVSGSSPAFIFMFVEAMADAGVYLGMNRKQAYVFAAQTLKGCAEMALETGLHPGILKDMVCSPGGTSIEGLRMMEKEGFRSSAIEALIACSDKGQKL